MEPYADVRTQYVQFAREATDSRTFVDWANAVAADPDVLAWLADLPPLKRQPNLVLAAARWHGVPAPGPYAGLREALLGDDGAIRDTILTRATQTNEVGRMATLVPVLDLVAEAELAPIALLEVGASAGLCLYPDRVDYRWTGDRVGSVVGELRGSGGPTLTCQVRGAFTAPREHPVIAWRGGLDLNPLDVTDEDAMRWLETLVWPEQDDRRDLLRQAVEIAAADPPDLRRGDLLTDLPALVEEASAFGTVVVQHSAVIAYLTPEDRERYRTMIGELVASGACHWISNESKTVLPAVTATGPEVPADHVTFVEALDGQVLAWTHGHGRSMRWFGP